MTIQSIIKKALPYIGIIALFAVISTVYFAPAQFEGKVLYQDDGAASKGFGSDVEKYKQETGIESRWTNSAFSGMPMYPFFGKCLGYLNTITDWFSLKALVLKGESWLVFMMLLGFFILMKAFRIRNDLAVVGALMWALSSYFIIIIQVGHLWKFMTLAFIPPTIAGLVWAYRGEYLKGASVTGFFTALQINSNHPQMSYYFVFVMAAIVLAYLVDAIKEKQIKRFVIASVLVLAAGIIGASTNLTNVYQSYQYSKETMRGGSELTLPHESGAESTSNEKGLDRDYITGWSYGIGETWTLLIPNTKGGATGYIGTKNLPQSGIRQEYKQFLSQQNAYWGDQPFTAGPVYVGAFVCVLFILGLFIVKSRLKWALLAMTLFSILLSWGRNFMPFTDFFIEYVPMYAKFRTVSSILVIAQFTIPLLAVLTIREIIENPSLLKEKRSAVLVSLGLTGGMALLFALLPTTFFRFLSAMEAEYFLPQAQNNPQLAEVIGLIEQVRSGIFTADAWRSVGVIAVGTAITALFVFGKIRRNVFVLLLGLLITVDMWAIDKRYLSYDHYHSPKKVDEIVAAKTPADEHILQDQSLNYRVYNSTVNTFNDNTTSRFHQSIGGYHAAKLQRYQDIIEHQLAKGNLEVFNMLNTKYFIMKGEDGQPTVQLNPSANGNAWFVHEIKWVKSANEEMTELSGINTKTTALIDTRFESVVKNRSITTVDSTATIELTEAYPNKLVYKSHSQTGGLALFSEVFYPKGWVCAIDGENVPIARANYILRAVEVPAGEHEIVFTFDLDSIDVTEFISISALIIILLGLVVMIGLESRKALKKPLES